MKKSITIVVCYMLFISFLTFASCQLNEQSSMIEKSLVSAGENRSELEKVLLHYSQNTKDSLKYKAAVFLVENMKDHYYHVIREKKKWNKLLKLSDSLISSKNESFEDIIGESATHISENVPLFVNDSRTIKANDLINNIDTAFETWPKPWNSFLSFEDFCNYILPYKLKNEPPELYHRTRFYQKYSDKISASSSIQSMIRTIQEFSSIPENYKLYKPIPWDLAISDIKSGKMVDCINNSNLSGIKGRSIGIPTALDFTIWPNTKGSHYWNAIVFSNDSLLYADNDFFFGEPGSYRLRNKVSKIYRHMYSVQKNSKSIRRGISWLYNPYLKDVTSQYIKTTEVNIKTAELTKEGTDVFLCIFNSFEWKPIALGKLNGFDASFKDVGFGNIHIVAYLKGSQLIPISNIFSIDETGNIKEYSPDRRKSRKIVLTRKTKETRVKTFSGKNIGGEFQLSNDADFKNNILVYKIMDSVFTPKTIQISSPGKFRYARYINSTTNEIELAEVNWFSKNRKINVEIENDYKSKTAKNLVDGDLLTFYSSQESLDESEWISFDFGKKEAISSLYFASRSDLNYIVPGDQYELFYWDDKWISLGNKKAEDYELKYNNVPENTVLWLRNLTRGIEEELFTYRNNKQYFWNLSEY